MPVVLDRHFFCPGGGAGEIFFRPDLNSVHPRNDAAPEFVGRRSLVASVAAATARRFSRRTKYAFIYGVF